MDFESLKEQFVEQFNAIKTKVQDNEIYIKLKERYDGLQPNVQTTIKVGSIFLVVYFFYSIPASFVSSASDKMVFFEENRALTRDLIRAGRIAQSVQLPPPAPETSQLTTQIESKLKIEQVIDKQKGNIVSTTNVASKEIVPKSIKQSGVKASIKQLTIRQTIKLGESFNQISSSKLMNIAIQADAKDPHYFNVDYEIAAFDVPRNALEELATDDKDSKGKAGKGAGGKKGRSRFKSKKKGKDE